MDTDDFDERQPLLEAGEDGVLSARSISPSRRTEAGEASAPHQQTAIEMPTSPLASQARTKFQSNFGESVITSFLTFCCPCVLPFSLIAIYFSSRAAECNDAEDQDDNQRRLYALIARILWIGSLLVALVCYILVFIVVFGLLQPL